jgi:hypothetical protein
MRDLSVAFTSDLLKTAQSEKSADFMSSERGLNGLSEDWLNMPFEQVFRHVAGDNLLVCIQSLEKSFAHFRGDFESDV